jgi:hypothetical protein
MGGIVLSKRLGVGLGEAEAPAIEPIFLAPLFKKKKSSTIYKILNFIYIKNS